MTQHMEAETTTEPERLLPRYPVYVPSKGRHEKGLTAEWLDRDRVPYSLVVEPQEADAYRAAFGDSPFCTVLVLPFSNLGSVVPARNWIRKHSESLGFKRHWSFDDNIRGMIVRYGRRRFPCSGGLAMAAVEDFTELYSNVAISGFDYEMFTFGDKGSKPFRTNVHVYSATLFNNETEFEWRGRYNEDTDICLQALSAGWCTLLVNQYCVRKVATMRLKGGNSDELYKGDGRTHMSRELERRWPGIVTTRRRYGRAQHHIIGNWQKFTTPLERDPNVPPLDPEKYRGRIKVTGDLESQQVRDMVERHAP